MREKLLDLMKNEGLKSSQLAEMLEISPAVISHLLAGRNKPGFDLLQKILRRFPRINPDWLLLNSDQMYRDEPTDISEPTTERTARPIVPDDLFNATTNKDSASKTTEPESPIANQPISVRTETRTVRRVIILYEDRTFESYEPNKV